MTDYKVLPVDDLFVDPDYQRPRDDKWIKKLTKEWDDAQAGILEVSERRNGAVTNYAVFDGQHRYGSMLERGQKKAPCLVHTGLTPREEADLWVKLNKNRKAPTALQRFNAQLFAGDKRAVAINKVVEGAGWRIGKLTQGKPHDAIEGVYSLEYIFKQRKGAELLHETLTLADTWKGDDKANSGDFLGGIAVFLRTYADNRVVNLSETARKKLAEVSPIVYLRRAQAVNSGLNSGLKGAIAEELRRVTGKTKPRPVKEWKVRPGASDASGVIHDFYREGRLVGVVLQDNERGFDAYDRNGQAINTTPLPDLEKAQYLVEELSAS